MVFGRKKNTQSTERSKSGGGGGNDQSNAEFPWTGEDFAPCNFAYGHLRDNLPTAFKHDGRIHAETYVSSIGCIAGFAAQAAAFEKMKQKGIPLEPPHINTIKTENGKTYFFSDAQNQELCNFWDGDVPGCGLWPLAASAASQCGVPQSGLPPLEAMFAHISSQIGAEQVQLRLGNQERLNADPEQLLHDVWPLAVLCFNGKFPNSEHEFGVVSIKYRPIIASFLANHMIREVKDVLPPETALTLVMECAILCSKVDASQVPNVF